MYLKSLEMVGFKSFMNKTKLSFEPGMTAIVGPNGCGKSNISDAMRWVLGETSAKALRGSKMEDVIFNGTDARKPLGMSEVSVTFADCEKLLGMEYNEVTVTRRVFRDGQGQYLLNKTPCRLKDIQRLFMDTGVGTDSYSVMEQGRIDQILSSRPEDRREVFEEASGIMRFKADKKEAIRKLEQTEANLLRLADVIREVKRQIGSLQRQAGKARRYKEYRDELRRLDIYASRKRLTSLDGTMQEIEAEVAALTAKTKDGQHEIDVLERDTSALRESVLNTEREIGAAMEAGMQAQGRLDHTRELIQVNRQRIAEYKALSERNTREIADARQQIDERRHTLSDLEAQIEDLRRQEQAAEQELKAANARFEAHRQELDRTRGRIKSLREEAVEQESQAARLHNQLLEIEGRERETTLQRERLAGEKSQLTRTVSGNDQRQSEMGAALEGLRQDLAARKDALRILEEKRMARVEAARRLQQQIGELRTRIAAEEARRDLLAEDAAAQAGMPAGARQLLDAANPLGIDRAGVLGMLAEQVEVDAAYRTAFEAALRAWADALVVSDAEAGRDLLQRLEERQAGAARLLAANVARGNAAPPDGDRLADHVRAPDRLRGALDRLIGHVLVVDSVARVPSPVPAGLAFVTHGGAVIAGDGQYDLAIESGQPSNPLARRLAHDAVCQSLAALVVQRTQAEKDGADAQEAVARMDQAIREARATLEASLRAAAQKEGESQLVSREATETRKRLETVTWELETLESEGQSGTSRKDEIARRLDEIAAQRQRITTALSASSEQVQELEARHTDLNAAVTDSRIKFSAVRSRAENVALQRDSLRARVAELDASVRGRTEGLASYADSTARLEAEVAAAESHLAEMESAVRETAARADSLRKNRARQSAELADMDRILSGRRESLNGLRDAMGKLEIRRTEGRMQRRGMLDRLISEYKLTPEQIAEEPDPDFGAQGTPVLDELETRVEELRTKIEALGPVNLVAIEEYQELEQRFAFLTAQEQDLVNAKQQLMDMIRKINKTTSEMFRETFEKVNANFDGMFRKLFRGGSAKLVLVNEEDVLECGIEIIARPPGKRLQNISLLSGGERTLTAVSLLFAIYMIKPSPFCLLDELDAALDDSNIGRFVTVLQDFVSQSQFVVITHNRQTIAASGTIYGVTMQERGVSRIVSMKFQDATGAVEQAAPSGQVVEPAPEPASGPVVEPAPEPAAGV